MFFCVGANILVITIAIMSGNYEYIKQYNSFASELAAPDSGMEDNIRGNNIHSSPITVVSTFVTNYNTATCEGEKKPITDLKIPPSTTLFTKHKQPKVCKPPTALIQPHSAYLTV